MADTRKAPRWEDEDWKLQGPDMNKCPCRDCYLNWFELPSGGINKGGEYARCQVYEQKPYGILMENKTCPYYINENASKEE